MRKIFLSVFSDQGYKSRSESWYDGSPRRREMEVAPVLSSLVFTRPLNLFPFAVSQSRTKPEAQLFGLRLRQCCHIQRYRWLAQSSLRFLTSFLASAFEILALRLGRNLPLLWLDKSQWVYPAVCLPLEFQVQLKKMVIACTSRIVQFEIYDLLFPVTNIVDAWHFFELFNSFRLAISCKYSSCRSTLEEFPLRASFIQLHSSLLLHPTYL